MYAVITSNTSFKLKKKFQIWCEFQEDRTEQADKLIEILKTKDHWLGPMIDALIRNGQASLAEEFLHVNASTTSDQKTAWYR